MPSPRRLSTTSRLWHPRPSIGASDWMASMASGKARTATSTRAVAGDRPRSPTARPSGTNRMTLRLVSPRWRYCESGASPMRPKSHRPGAEGRPLNPSASGGIVAASTAPTLMTRRNATQLSVRRRRATRPATASAITVVMASPGRNHGRTPARDPQGLASLGRLGWAIIGKTLIKLCRPAIILTGTPPTDATDESLPTRPQTTFPSGPPGSVRARPAHQGVKIRLPRRGQFHVPLTTQTRIAVRMRHNGESWRMTRPIRQELRARQLVRRSIIAVDRQRA